MPGSPTRASAAKLAQLPAPVLERIFAFVCPHTMDSTYESQEQSSLEDACMLCDLRDLSYCLLVCKRWRAAAVKVLIRIETVHYCDREALLADRRKHKTFFDHNGEPEDTSRQRLKLLCRTLREDPARLGPLVEYFKLPYMLRESCQADLARTIAVLPNLRYVDLPEALYHDDNSYITLRMEVEARCLNLRKMTYMRGSERSLERVASGQVFRNLEVLEFRSLQADPTVILHALAILDGLRALKIVDSKVITDETMAHNSDMLPAFPALEELILEDTPGVTARGLQAYLSRADTSQALKVLSLSETGVTPWSLQDVLGAAPNLKRLTLSYVAIKSLPLAAGTSQVAPLASMSLETFHYEIMAAADSSPYSNILPSYYNYLSGSLLMGGLPHLRALYVRDANFPDTLAGLPQPAPKFARDAYKRPGSSGSQRSTGLASNISYNSLGSPAFPPRHNPRFSSNNPFAAFAGPNGPSGLPQTLEVFTKGDDELNWGMVKVEPDRKYDTSADEGLNNRPSSSYGLDNSALGWNSRAGARKSVFMGNGAGGFLAVPDNGRGRRGSAPDANGADEWPRPRSADTREKRSSRMDLWR
ncbi:hypothetical protein M406DRAFT_52154 [Cryphonectria parasitica EP155]|uniref:F-box domain-containing protein n=1 Tax=Cryphonectria parasitica (strain ATCC 38755 / EP155) TaxID=660469 RepID=A0A9P4XST0_CRYP1|nr:uncharacterized protein M406DRAFT_52154 [Cryphonectria parasitica EP155]KAF3760152.1 hypothetical protein M406DRAFT_52154 [Cryphonectria parasitica EP155]